MNISIPRPCHENWEAMSPEKQGRFCNACSKIVVDFTQMNTVEIQQYLAQPNSLRTCGRFKENQLTNKPVPVYEMINATWYSVLGYAKKITAIVALLFIFSQSVVAQKKADKPVTSATSNVNDNILLGEPAIVGRVAVCTPQYNNFKKPKGKQPDKNPPKNNKSSTDPKADAAQIVMGIPIKK